MPERDADRLAAAGEALQVLVRPILVRGKVKDALDEIAVDQLAELHILQRNIAALESLVPVEPVNLRIAGQIADGRKIEAPRLVERLKSEHPPTFEIRVLTAAIRSRVDGEHHAALKDAMGLVNDAETPEQRLELAELLAEIATRTTPAQKAATQQLMKTLVGEDHRLIRLREIELHLADDQLDEANEKLSDLEDESDPLWLQVYGNYLLRKGEGREAVRAFKKAAAILPNPDLLNAAAFVALRHGAADEAVDFFRAIVDSDQTDRHARHNLAMALLRVGRFEEAAAEFTALSTSETGRYRLLEAQALAHAGRLEDAIQCLAAGEQEQPLEALLLLSHLHWINRDPASAFALLQSNHTRFWTEEAFLLSYMDVCYAAEEDQEASRALRQVVSLRDAGLIRPDVVRTASFDELVETQREALQSRRKLHEKMLVGEAPWPLVERLQHQVPYWAWRVRTQPLPWVPSDKYERAEWAVYSTDGPIPFSDEPDLDGTESVVVDDTALITLHRLGMLSDVVAYFGRVYVAASSLLGHLNETRNLAFPQPSRRTAAVSIRHFFEQGLIGLRRGDDPAALVDDSAADEGQHGALSLRGFGEYLLSVGHLSDTEFERLAATTSTDAPGAVASDLTPASAVQLGRSALQILAQTGLLKKAVRGCRVVVSEDDLRSATVDSAAYGLREQVRDWHTELWEFVTQDPRFVGLDPALPDDHPSKSLHEVQEDPTFGALLVAQRERYILLADDRCLHRLASGADSQSRVRAVGTDQVLHAMHEQGVIDDDALADAVLTLVEWRYRFIVPTERVLVCIAKRYRQSPPGEGLRRIARYGHECLSDPGLPHYRNVTDIAPSYADRLVLHWSRLAGAFVGRLAHEEDISEDMWRSLVAWSGMELLPHAPRGLGPRAAHLNRIVSRHAMGTALTEAARAPDTARASKILARFARVLGFQEEEYSNFAAETIDGI